MPRKRQTLSGGEARRIALAAQGFDRPRPGSATDKRHFRRAMRLLGVLQLDFVNVLVPAHFLVIWSRLGPYDRTRFEQFLYGSGEFTEQWAHEASIVPVSHWPLLRHRRKNFQTGKNNPLLSLANREQYLAQVLAEVRKRGALTSTDLAPVAGPKRRAGDWQRSIPRRALDFHFGRGQLAVRERLPNFQRRYDLPERLIDDSHRVSRMNKADADRELLRQAADSLGVATLQDLADYFRMSPRDVAPRLPELVEQGKLQSVQVQGWQEPAYLARSARVPRRIAGASLLSPFDPVVWFRPRAERVFGFRYRIEIYVPREKRKYGYYVLPFLLGDRIVARVDLKADRHNRLLLVQAAHPEPEIDEGTTVTFLAQELHAVREWLHLESIIVKPHGRFSRSLARSVVAY